MPSHRTPTELQRLLAGLSHGPAVQDFGRISFGAVRLDRALAGGLARAALHELLVDGEADRPAAVAVVLGLAGRAAQGRAVLWVRQDSWGTAARRPHPPGLAVFGLDPAQMLLVRAADPGAVLGAGVEGARCAALGAVLIEPSAASRPLDLTASRRLSLAAQASGVFTLLLRLAPAPPSAAQTRWLVAGRPSRALAANAPGPPTFMLRLLRHRQGLGKQQWDVEWDHARRRFQDLPPARPAPAPGAVVAFPADRPVAAGGVAAA